MSIEAVKDFYEKIASDEEFQNKLNELQDKATKGLELPLAPDKKEEMVKDVIIPFAKEQGFDFSIEDIKEFEKSIVEQLDEKQLKNISAGERVINGAGIVLPFNVCKVIGFGVGAIVGNGYWSLCALAGFGWGAGYCFLPGSGFSGDEIAIL